MKPIIISIAIAVSLSQNVNAKCDKNSKTLFSCLTQKGKQIEVCDGGKNITYSFGRPHLKPEILLTVSRDQASTSQWNGQGRYISYSVDIPNGETIYDVFFAADRLSDEQTIDAGVNVLIKNNLIATVNCSGKHITNNLQDLDLKPSN